MITRPDVWRKTEARLQRRKPYSYRQARLIFEALYREARALRALPSHDPLDGLDADLRLADALRRLPR